MAGKDRLNLTDTKSIRNWMNGSAAPASDDAYRALRKVLAEAPGNEALLPDLDAAFQQARHPTALGPAIQRTDDASDSPSPAAKRAKVWRTGKTLPPIFGLIEFRLRLGSNAGPDEETCPVHAVLRPGQSECVVDGRTVLIGFRHLSLAFQAPDHALLEETVLGSDARPSPAGVLRVPGGWRLEPTDHGSVLLHDPIGGAALFTLTRDGADAAPTKIQLFGENGGLDVRDPLKPDRPPQEGKKKSAVINAIFGEKRDPNGTGRYLLGQGEVWREDES